LGGSLFCGNGKNLLYRQADLNSIGIDLVPNFVQICRDKGLNAIQGSAIDLPFTSETFKEYTSNISISRGHIWWQKGNWMFEFTK
jgi:hypothetical protein